jgi:large subunit ribosomal protein L24
MKQKFSKHWIGSKQPRKQRKYRANVPNHLKHKLMSANLSKELRTKHGKRNFPIRKEDNVRIMKGEFKGKVGKIDVIDTKKLRVGIAGINRTKKDGGKVAVWFDASNLQIKELYLEDKQRKKALERKANTKVEVKAEKKEDKASSENKVSEKSKLVEKKK